MRKVAIASKELVNDCVLYAVLLAESVARQLFLGAVTGSENPGAGNSDVTSDTRTVMAGMLVTTFPYNTATTGSAGEQRDVLAVTRVAAKLQKAAMAESERQALHQVALSAVPELVSAAVGTSRRVDEGLSGVARKQNKGSQPTGGGGAACKMVTPPKRGCQWETHAYCGRGGQGCVT